jgi:hypothetical protein
VLTLISVAATDTPGAERGRARPTTRAASAVSSCPRTRTRSRADPSAARGRSSSALVAYVASRYTPPRWMRDAPVASLSAPYVDRAAQGGTISGLPGTPSPRGWVDARMARS